MVELTQGPRLTHTHATLIRSKYTLFSNNICVCWWHPIVNLPENVLYIQITCKQCAAIHISNNNYVDYITWFIWLRLDREYAHGRSNWSGKFTWNLLIIHLEFSGWVRMQFGLPFFLHKVILLLIKRINIKCIWNTYAAPLVFSKTSFQGRVPTLFLMSLLKFACNYLLLHTTYVWRYNFEYTFTQ